MITVDELREAIEKGFIKGKTVSVVRRNTKYMTMYYQVKK